MKKFKDLVEQKDSNSRELENLFKQRRRGKISDKEFIENWLKIFGDPREEKIDMHEEEKCNFEGDVVNNGN